MKLQALLGLCAHSICASGDIVDNAHCFCCIYRDIIEYHDNFLDNNREMIFLISPNPN